MTERKYPGALSLIAWGTLLLFVNITYSHIIQWLCKSYSKDTTYFW